MTSDSTLNIYPGEPLRVHELTSFEIPDQEFAEIQKILLFHRGFNLQAYKDGCVRRRIAIRIRANHCPSVQDYCNLLLSEKNEADLLIKVLTIHVSQFFRNLSAFEILRTEIIPHLFAAARKKGQKSLRFWSLGCASGEEPYSMALILAEHFARDMQEISVSIDATDVDSAILKTAEKAVYNHDRLLEAPLNYVQKYFEEEGIYYSLSPVIKDMVNFSLGDMFDDSIYQECDLLLCRNVLIYFTREQQEKILRNISRGLGRDGFLMLGKSETILGNSRTHFQSAYPMERIYRPLGSF